MRATKGRTIEIKIAPPKVPFSQGLIKLIDNGFGFSKSNLIKQRSVIAIAHIPKKIGKDITTACA